MKLCSPALTIQQNQVRIMLFYKSQNIIMNAVPARKGKKNNAYKQGGQKLMTNPVNNKGVEFLKGLVEDNEILEI